MTVVVKVTFLVKMTVLVVQIIMIPLWAPICLQACLVVGLHLSHQAIQAFRAVSLLNLSACPVVGRRINPPACQADSNQFLRGAELKREKPPWQQGVTLNKMMTAIMMIVTML